MAGAFEIVENTLIQPVHVLVQQAVGTLSGELRAPMTAALTVYVIWTGWMILQGTIQEPVMETIKRLFKACIVFSLATGASEYMTYFAEPMLTELPNAIGKALLGKTDVKGNAFDVIMGKVSVAIDQGWQQTPYTGYFRFLFICIVVYLGASFVCIAGFVSMIYAKFALGLVLALGPIFIACAMFETTRRFAEAFVGTAVGFVILQALVSALLALVMASISTAVSGIDGSTIGVADTIISLPIQCVICGLLFTRLPGIASGLGAGAYFQLQGVPAALRNGAAVPARSFANRVASGVTRGRYTPYPHVGAAGVGRATGSGGATDYRKSRGLG